MNNFLHGMSAMERGLWASAAVAVLLIGIFAELYDPIDAFTGANDTAATIAEYAYEDCRSDGGRRFACEIEAVQLAESRGYPRDAASAKVRELQQAELRSKTAN